MLTSLMAGRFSDVMYAKDFGAVANGVADDSAALAAAFASCSASGLTLYLSPGTYLVGAAIVVTLTGDLSIVLDQRAVIKGATGYSTPILSFDGSTNAYGVSIKGGTIDSSLRGYVDATQSGTCVAVDFMREFLFDGVRIVAATNYWSEAPLHGDSGITTVGSTNGRIVNCYFRGHPDIGIYLSGGGSTAHTDDSGCIIVANCHFDRCYVGVSIKRQVPQVIIQGNVFKQCNFGVGAWEADSSGTTIGPGEKALISNNIFKFIQASAINMHNGSGIVISGNLIEDVGYLNSDGTTSSGAGYGIFFNGTTDSLCTGNIIRIKEWGSYSEQYGILISNFTSADTATYTASGNSISGNKIEGFYTGIRESPGVGLNAITINRITGATLKYYGTSPRSDISDLGLVYAQPIVVQSTTSRTLNINDAGCTVRCTNSSATTITVPPNSSVPFQIGTNINVRQSNTGQVTLAPGSGVSLLSRPGLLLGGVYAAATLEKVGTDIWEISGDLTA